MNTLSSAHNPALKHLAKLLQSGRTRRQHGQAVLEGTHLLSAYLDNGGQPLKVYVPAHKQQQPETAALLARLPADSIVVVSGEALQKITSLTDADEITTLIACPTPPPFDGQADCVVLEQVQDPGNIGTILRSAAALGVRQVLAMKGSAALWSPKVLRAGMGAHFALRLVESLAPEALDALQVPLIVTSSHQGELVQHQRLPWPCAWALGHEGQGVGEAVAARASLAVRIGQPGGEESLNVAAAAAICLHASAVGAAAQAFPA